MNNEGKVAYFSMEIGLESGIPTYSGGLGMLAGDTVRSAANLKIPLVAVTLLHRKGYFYQKLDARGNQTEEPVAWDVDDYLEEESERTSVTIEGRTVHLRAWRYEVTGSSGFVVPVLLLDTDLAENSDWDRTLTHYLYGGDQRYRLCQEVILGIGGVKILRALGYSDIKRYHLNEGHAALCTLELVSEHVESKGQNTIDDEVVQTVRRQCVFTTHTPVAAGHDQFPLDLVQKVMGNHPVLERKDIFLHDNVLNLTYVALNLCHYVNGVARKHQEVSSLMFADYVIDSITNGVNVTTWTSRPFQDLFDRYIPSWREDNYSLRYALNIPREEVWMAHERSKKALLEFVNRETNAGMDGDVLTIGFARRATAYKRGNLIFTDTERLKKITSQAGSLQLVFGGKAHLSDEGGKDVIRAIFKAKEELKDFIKIAYLTNYDMDLGRLMTSGVDVWLNNPIPPREASGTSGMKAALNGVPSLSVLDGWWLEGCIEGVTGWAFGSPSQNQKDKNENELDASSLYDRLESTILPLYYNRRRDFINIMLHTIALNGSFFNTQRMMHQYVLKAYFE